MYGEIQISKIDTCACTRIFNFNFNFKFRNLKRAHAPNLQRIFNFNFKILIVYAWGVQKSENRINTEFETSNSGICAHKLENIFYS